MKCKAFTLIESILICTISILLISIVSLPILHHTQQQNLEMEALSITQDIEFVRNLSQLQSEKLKMEFLGTHNKYRFETTQGGMGKPGRFIERKFHPTIGFPFFFSITSVSYVDEIGSIKTGSINFGSTSSDSYGTLVFDSTGTPNQGGHVVIMTRNTNQALAVIVKPVTGRVRVGKVHFIHP
jgi:type II secretory pathway pseudopilin PulG